MRSKLANAGIAGNAIGAHMPPGWAGATVTLGVTSPAYSTCTTPPSGSGTSMRCVFGPAAIAVPASVAAASPAKANNEGFIRETPFTFRFPGCEGRENYRAILNGRFPKRLDDKQFMPGHRPNLDWGAET